jgi:hypothetical protein
MLTVKQHVRASEFAVAAAIVSICFQLILFKIGPTTLLYQAVLMCVVVLSTAALGDERGRFDIRQPWAVLMVFHIPFWIVGTLNTIFEKGQGSDWTFERVGQIPSALLIISTGFLFIGMGYRMGLKVYANRTRHDKPYPWDCSRLVPLTIAIYALAWLVRYSHGESLQAATFSMLLEQSPLPAYVRALSGPIPMFLILIVWGAHYSNPDRRDIFRLALVVTVGELIWAVIIGTSKSLFVLPIFLPMIPYIIFNRSIPLRRLALSVGVLIFLAYPYASALREVYFILDGPTRSVARELAFQQSSLWSTFNSELIGNYATQAMERSGGIGALNQLLQLDEQGRLNIRGEFYWRAVVGLIPRFLWADKPILLEGVYFSAYLQGWTGNISDIDPAAISGSVAPTLFGSFFWNLGWPGVVLTSFVLGFFSGRVFSYLKRRNNLADPASFLYYVSILSLLDTTESEVVKFPSSLVWSIAVAWVIIRALGWHKKPLWQTGANGHCRTGSHPVS